MTAGRFSVWLPVMYIYRASTSLSSGKILLTDVGSKMWLFLVSVLPHRWWNSLCSADLCQNECNILILLTEWFCFWLFFEDFLKTLQMLPIRFSVVWINKSILFTWEMVGNVELSKDFLFLNVLISHCVTNDLVFFFFFGEHLSH